MNWRKTRAAGAGRVGYDRAHAADARARATGVFGRTRSTRNRNSAARSASSWLSPPRDNFLRRTKFSAMRLQEWLRCAASRGCSGLADDDVNVRDHRRGHRRHGFRRRALTGEPSDRWLGVIALAVRFTPTRAASLAAGWGGDGTVPDDDGRPRKEPSREVLSKRDAGDLRFFSFACGAPHSQPCAVVAPKRRGREAAATRPGKTPPAGVAALVVAASTQPQDARQVARRLRENLSKGSAYYVRSRSGAMDRRGAQTRAASLQTGRRTRPDASEAHTALGERILLLDDLQQAEQDRADGARINPDNLGARRLSRGLLDQEQLGRE